MSPWKEWLPWAIGALCAVLVVGCLAFVRRRPKVSLTAAVEKPPPLDPFIFGSAQEKRLAIRRKGNPVSVLISDAAARATPRQGVVVDRSLGGLGVAVDRPAAVGTVLSVRPAHSDGGVSWVQVEVRSCRQQGDSWCLGCQFVRVPDSSLLWHFG